jgi:glycosyltransferase involved in cell wall biosynthesis
MADLDRVVRGVRRRLRGRSGPPEAAPPAAPWEGTPRQVEEDHTHVGPVMDEIVTRTRRRMAPAGLDDDYDLAYEHFDVAHFLLQARHLLTVDDVDPLAQFLGNGARAKASPEVNFDMRAYLARHPERAAGPGSSPYVAWLRDGRDAGEIADPAPRLEEMAEVLGAEPQAVAGELAALRSDLQERLRHGTLGEMFARAAEVEPLVGEVWPETTRMLVPPFFSDLTVRQVSSLHAAQRAAGFARARVVLVIADPRWGGGRRAEGHIAHALTGSATSGIAPADVVVLYTDAGGSAPPGRFPDGVREVDLTALLGDLPDEAAERVLVELVRSLRADAVVNINSGLLYKAMATYGRALAASERLFLVLFCNEQLAFGSWVGRPLRYVYRCFDLVEGIITDSAYLGDWLRERHQLGPGLDDRLHVFRAPVDPDVPVAPAADPRPDGRPQVFWAGRFDRQKRVDLAFEVARRMPEIDLRMWGEPVLHVGGVGAPPANAIMEGPYAHFSELDLGQADVWLYTSGWDGVPSQLLEVAMTGVPLVASQVGGTGEVLGEDDAWPVVDADDPDAYVAAIRAVLADPVDARRRALALRERMLGERTAQQYAAQVVGVLLDGDGGAR